MEINRDDHDAYSPSGGQKWFASKGIGSRGQTVTLNFICDKEEQIAPLAHGLGIAHNVTMHQKAEYIAPAEHYDWLTNPD